MRTLFFAVIAVLCTACHVYPSIPVSSVGSQVGSNTAVRIYLNDVGRKSVETQIGPQVNFFDGIVVSRDSAAFTVDASRIKRLTTPDERYENPRRVTVPANGLASVAVDKISTKRSVLLGGAIAVGALLVGDIASGGELFGIGRGGKSSSEAK